MGNQSLSKQPYEGFEQGPIRPPSEAQSLLIRVTRNCPWNRCTFCPVYKRDKYSKRPVEHVIEDINQVHKIITRLKESCDHQGNISRQDLSRVFDRTVGDDPDAFQAALSWFRNGMESIFLQDADSLKLKPDALVTVLKHLRSCFPEIKRITSYARSQTITRISDDDMKELERAGLNRIHIGLESGSDKVLTMVKKGATQAIHIEAGKRVKQAGIELSEYVMPGLGGTQYSQEHATESAHALNQINPDFIRLRTLSIPNSLPLSNDVREGRFTPCTELEVTHELYSFIENLEGITSTIKSDHMLNLFEDLEGRLPEDREMLLKNLKSYLELDPFEQSIYLLGRRMGLFRGLPDMSIPQRRERVELTARQLNVTPDNVNDVIHEIKKQFL